VFLLEVSTQSESTLWSSKLIVLSIGSIRALRPTLGSRLSPDNSVLELGGRSMLLVCRIGS